MHILITGCSSGIGLCAAKTCYLQGYQVVATVRTEQDKQRLEQHGVNVVIMDLTDADSVNAGFQQALTLLDGRIDALFNNAAYGQPGAVEDLSRTALEQQFAANVFGTQQLTNLVIKQMRQQGGEGRIVYNSSVLGLVCLAYRGAYNASKFALEALVDTARLELHDTRIQLSLIEPGPIVSQFRANAFVKYQQHIHAADSAHAQTYAAMEARLTKEGPAAPFTLPADAVVKKLLHALTAKRAKTRYYVTFPTYLLASLKWALPDRWMDWLVRRIT